MESDGGTAADGAAQGPPAQVDFAMVLCDTSAYRFSKAKRFLRSIWIFGSPQLRDVDAALLQLSQLLEQAGFSVWRQPQDDPAFVVLLLSGSPARLRREHFREQLDSFLSSHRHGIGEFTPREADPSAFAPARRIGLLRPALAALEPDLRGRALRSDLLQLVHIFPLHDRRFTAQLLIHLTHHLLPKTQTLHQLRNVYGERVAFYFAFRSTMQRWLLAPAAFGLFLTMLRAVYPEQAALLTPLFGLSVPLWGTLMLEAWQLQQQELAVIWGVDHLRETEVVRPEFKGEQVINVVTGESALYYPMWKRVLKRCVTIPILGAQLLLLTGIIIGLYSVWTQIHSSNLNKALKTLLVVLISASWGVLVEFLNWHFFLRIASALNKWENYRTTTDFERHLVLKLFAFLFVDGFLWYFLLAFLHIPFGAQFVRFFALQADGFDGMFWEHALVTSVETLLLFCMPLATVWSVLPTVLRLLRAIGGPRKARMSDAFDVPKADGGEGEGVDVETAPLRAASSMGSVLDAATENSDSDSDHAELNLCRGTCLDRHRVYTRKQRSAMLRLRRTLRAMVEVDSLLDEARRPVYDPMLDMARIALEFGYVLMFTVVWPLAPMACLLASFLEQRAVVFRLCMASQRPVSHRCNGLGTGNAWYSIFAFMVSVSVLVNCAMITLATRQLDVFFSKPLPPFDKLLVAVVAEHLLLAAKMSLSAAFPDYPDALLAGARQVERDLASKHLRHVYGESGVWTSEGLSARRGDPHLISVYPTSGPTTGATLVSLRGESLGRAVNRGEICVTLQPPRERREKGEAVLVQASFMSERKLSCVIPPAKSAGVCALTLWQPEAKAKEAKQAKEASGKRLAAAAPSAAEAVGGGGAAGTPAEAALRPCTFTYYAPCSVTRLKPNNGPLQGGTAVRLLGSGFVQTGESTVLVRMRGVEHCVPAAFISESEMRFMAPEFPDAGDARVLLALNGQQYDAGAALVFQYKRAAVCIVQ